MHDYTTKVENKQLFWNRKMIETFIQLYKENECLYNKNHPDHKDKTIQLAAFKNILQNMKQFLPNLKLKDLIEKLKAIRTQFSKELSLVKRAKAMGNTYVPKMWCFNQLEFLRPRPKQLSGDYGNANDSDDVHSDDSDFSNELSRSVTEYRWEREDLKIFINLLKNYPILYDPKHEHYQNKKMTSKARALLLRETQKIDPKINSTIMNNKIRAMTKQYRQELTRKMQAQKNNEKYTSRFWCFDLLSFLNPQNHDITSNNERTSHNDINYDNSTTEMDQIQYEINNEAFDIEPIHQVIIENEAEYAEELQIEPIEDIKYNNQNVIDYEYDENSYEMADTQNCEYKEEPFDKTETEYLVETIEFAQPECVTKMENSVDNSKNNTNVKYEWLGKLVVSQLGLISSKYHNELASDVQNLIHDYIVKSKEISSVKSTDSNKKNDNDPSSPPSSNVSFNLRFV